MNAIQKINLVSATFFTSITMNEMRITESVIVLMISNYSIS